MRLPLVIAPLLLMAAPVAAQGGNQVEIDMVGFKYMPSTITLRHGQAYTLHFVNRGNGGHDFVAKSFFSAAGVAPADRSLVREGEIELSGGDSADVHIVAPRPGKYEAHCSHFMHSAFGMKASILVI